MSTPEETAALALRWFLRGGGWEVLVRELAWAAVRATGGEQRSIEWLTPLVEARLAERIDVLEFVVDRASTIARQAQVLGRPHDLEGAETHALLDGYEEALQTFCRHYFEVLEWAADLISERIGGSERRSKRFRVPLRRRRPPADLDIPLIFAEELNARPQAARRARSPRSLEATETGSAARAVAPSTGRGATRSSIAEYPHAREGVTVSSSRADSV